MKQARPEAAQLKFVIVGHVDHGKSTLIGRLLYDTDSLPASKMEEVRRESAAHGRDMELAFVMDHLEEERRKNITIDTSQIFFTTSDCEYVIIDAPGHREFMRNMVTGASQAEAAVFVIDAAEGLREQTRRHAYVLSMLGIEQVIVLVNKMDLVGWSGGRFEEVSSQMKSFLAGLGISPLVMIPASARLGENIVRRGAAMPWAQGPTLLEALGGLRHTPAKDMMPLRLPVQDCYRIDGKAILVGRVERGRMTAGQQIVFVPSGIRTRVASVEEFGRSVTEAETGRSIGFTVEDPGRIARGQVACDADSPAAATDRLSATLFWLADRPFGIDEPLRFRCATQEVPCRIERIDRLMDSSTLELLSTDARTMSATQVGHVILRTDRPVACETFAQMPQLGRFVVLREHDVEAGGVVVGTSA